MDWVEFEPTISASKGAKSVHALVRSTTVTGQGQLYLFKKKFIYQSRAADLSRIAF
jgi:hypothetical protein